ncbi:unnamed protein product [Microthlaspi erraticum]|uniref:N-acetyltransferase domain-containing protein n=1 Tax=Microthlaspi erraticum TaxID=1685480 RepID=A0A6D2JMM9_9BRAS|nr:unnamed protein product [Microthlaspi erraticum]
METDFSRVTLRPFDLMDARDFLRWAGDDRVTGNLRWPTFTTEEEALAFIRDACLPHPWRRSICIDDRSTGFISIFPETGDDSKNRIKPSQVALSVLCNVKPRSIGKCTNRIIF